MQTYAISSVRDQVTEIRAAILLKGEFIAGCEELAILCQEVSEQNRIIGIEQIAEWEGWLFESLPDQTVRFRSPRQRAA
jgi:hypothetical protein